MASLAGFCVAKRMSPEQISSVLAAANDNLSEPLPESEVGGVANSIARYADQFRLASDDVGLSRQVAEHLQSSFRAIGKKQWLFWDGTRWDFSKGNVKVAEAVKQVMTEFREGLRANDPDGDRAKSLCTAVKVRNMLDLAVTDDCLQINPSELDADCNLLNLKNGVLHLSTKEVGPHRPEDMLTMTAAVDYDPAATCPVFDSFLERIQPEAEMQRFILRCFGYLLTGQPVEQHFMIATGPAQNGKSVLIGTIRDLFGDYGATAEPSTFIVQRSERVRSDLARLRGVRMVSTSELNPGERLDGSLVKRISGGEPIAARRLYEGESEFKPQCTVIMTTNDMPILNGGDEALARRMLVLPFPVSIPMTERDTHLSRKLAAERSGILNRILEGLADYQERGLAVPESVRRATDDFMQKSDLIGTFLSDHYEKVAGAGAKAGEMYGTYKVWCVMDGLSPMCNRQFKEAVTRKLGEAVHTRSGNVYVGWSLRPKVAG